MSALICDKHEDEIESVYLCASCLEEYKLVRRLAKELVESVIAYSKAIHSCANDPAKMASFCTAQGDDLDILFSAWLTKAHTLQAVLRKK